MIESGLLDSYAFIELFTALEDYGIEIQPTRIDRSKLRTIKGIEELIENTIKRIGLLKYYHLDLVKQQMKLL